MTESATYCRVCLETKVDNFSLYTQMQEMFLPNVIENVANIVISPFNEPDAHICKECAKAIIQADEIIKRCRESNKILLKHGSTFPCHVKYEDLAMQRLNPQVEKMLEQQLASTILEPNQIETCVSIRNTDQNLADKTRSCKTEYQQIKNFKDLKQEMPDIPELDSANENLFVQPEMLVESILESSQDTITTLTQTNMNIPNCNISSIVASLSRSTTPTTTIYHSHFKISKTKKNFQRNREQYLKRKIRNYPVKEPLKLIGGAGVVRKRKPKTFHRAIPNFYFRCELCHEFESNVASYAVTHLNTVHNIDRPAIFRCPHCDTKPFIKNQSLQEHIATIHQLKPKPRDFLCSECSKTFIKNCHLQKHLLSVHKQGKMPYHCDTSDCGKEYVDSFALRKHIKQVHSVAATDTFSCIQCGYKFRQKARLEAHVKRARCMPQSLACRHCEHTFSKLMLLKEHVQSMHS